MRQSREVIRGRWTALAEAMDANDVSKVAKMLQAQVNRQLYS